MPGIVVVDDLAAKSYPMPCDCDGRDEVFIGRIREDLSSPNGLAFWCVSDNLRKGAATNAVQIAELLVRKRKRGRGQRSVVAALQSPAGAIEAASSRIDQPSDASPRHYSRTRLYASWLRLLPASDPFDARPFQAHARLRRHELLRLAVSAGPSHAARDARASAGQDHRETIRVTASGRTDAGVHALGQVVSFASDTQLEPEVLQRRSTPTLPLDMAIVGLRVRPTAFTPRATPSARRYRYTIDDGPMRDVFARSLVWQYRRL